jgi:hypothetical protein
MLNLAVITGAKSFDVIGFHRLFWSLKGINSYVQHIDDFASSSEAVRSGYDGVLFFFWLKEDPTDDGLPEYCGKPKSAIEHLTQTGQGIIVLHHALLAYPEWSFWDAIVGIDNRELAKYQHDENIRIEVVDKPHPITHGLSDWSMIDETYLMPDALKDKDILLQTQHKQSMKTLAWAHQYASNNIFCFQSGHDAQAWEDKNFKNVLERGIKWSCGHL